MRGSKLFRNREPRAQFVPDVRSVRAAADKLQPMVASPAHIGSAAGGGFGRGMSTSPRCQDDESSNRQRQCQRCGATALMVE